MPSPAPAPKTLIVLHHSHTDVGYTEHQSIVARWHADFIRQAIAAVAVGRQRRNKFLGGFKWICETFWGVEQFLARATNAEIAAFREALRKGDIGLSASYLNFNELIGDAVLRRVIRRAVAFGESVGIAVDCAMTADVNGYSWGFAQALCDSGVRNLFTCIHTHHGLYPLGRQQLAFWWETPRGDQLLVWSGEHYHFGNELGLVPGAVSSYLTKDECSAEMIYSNPWGVAEKRIPRYLARLAVAGYPYNFVPVMTSGLRTDNAPPNTAILDFVARWNETHGDRVRIQMATLNDFFQLLRAQPQELPVYRGDWPDWWSDGIASEPAATKLFRQAQRDLNLHQQIVAKHPHSTRTPGFPKSPGSLDSIETELALYAEHTFGHSSSMSHPWDTRVHAIAARKRAYAATAYEAIRGRLADAVAGLGATTLNPAAPLHYKVINPWDHPVSGIIRLAVGHHEYYERKLDRGADVIDTKTGESLPCQVEQLPLAADFCVPLVLAGGAERVFALQPAKRSVEPEYRSGITSLNTEQVRIAWREPTGISTWADGKSGKDLLRTDRRYPPLTLVHEFTPVANQAEICTVRGAMDLNRKGPNARRTAATLVHTGTVATGPVFTTVELVYQVTGLRHCNIRLLAHAHLRRVDVSVCLHKESFWEPENLYLSLPFAPGTWPASLWLDKTGAAVRPRVDQIPGSLADYYCCQAGLALVARDMGLVVATPDTPLIQVGPLEYGPRRLMGDPALPADPAHLFAWLMTNYWETNFTASLGGFYEFNFSIAWGEAFNETAMALRACRDMSQGLLCFRLQESAA